MKNIFVLLLILLNIKVDAQLFTTLFKNENIIALNQGNLRLNTLQFDGKIYYTTPYGTPAEGASVLCVVDVNGKNGKQLPQTRMVGSNFLAATENYIYYNTYSSATDAYYLYRMHKKTEQVEAIILEKSRDRWFYATGITKMFSKMYTYKDKLVLAGFYPVKNSAMPGRSLCIIEDNSPYAILLSIVNETSKDIGISTSFFLTRDEIAITDSLLYHYDYYPETHEKSIHYYVRTYKDDLKPYNNESEIHLLKSGYEPIETKLVSLYGLGYSLIRKLDVPVEDGNAYLLEIKGKNGNRIGNPFVINSDGAFMKAIDNYIFFGDRMHLYKYDVNTKNMATLISLKKDAAELLYGIGLIQNQEFLLKSEDGTIFLGINTFHDYGSQYPKKIGTQKILAINPNNSIDTICTVTGVDCQRPNYDLDLSPSFVLGKSLYRIHNDYENKTQWLEKYNKENNWKPVRIDYPEIKKYYKCDDQYNSPTVFQLPYGLLINTRYRNHKKTKDIELMYLYTE